VAERRSTSTSNFGVSKRESHDASAFYNRFRAPELSPDEDVLPPKPVDDPFVFGDARQMDEVADGSVALVVTSPPYFAGKAYEEELERDGVPGSYLEYLQLLTEVFGECVRKLEPGGRIAVNVANLGRKPYRSLSADVIGILQDDLGLLLRGELIWQKGEGATGSCAWGSFRSATNPVLRDITERVIIASKGRFDRARSIERRMTEGLPYKDSLMTEDFMALTLDLWNIPPERARRVGHPAPFPVELPEKLIRLYTFSDDLVLDPFMGSGSTLVAAGMLGRRYIGYDLDNSYVDLARQRVRDALSTNYHRQERLFTPSASSSPATGEEAGLESFEARARREGKGAHKLAGQLLSEAGFRIEAEGHRIRKTGVAVSFSALDDTGGHWLFDVAGPFTTYRGGLLRTEAVWRSLGRAHALRGRGSPAVPLVLLSTALPHRPSEGDTALRAAGPQAFFDLIEMLADPDRGRLARYATEGSGPGPLPGFWSAEDLARADS